MPDPLDFFTDRALLLEVQTADGTPATPEPNVNAFQLFDGKSQVAVDEIERNPDRTFFAGDEGVPVNERLTIDGTFELVPPLTPGTQPAPCEPMLLIGGMTRTYAPGVTRYNPISRDIKCATMHWFHGRHFYEGVDSRAMISGLTFKIDDFLKATTKLQGTPTQIEDSALPSNIDYSAFRDPVPTVSANTSMFVGDLEVLGKELSVDYGSDLKSKNFTGGKRFHRISGRKPTYKAIFAVTDLADFDPYALRRARAKILFYYTVRDDDGRETMCVVRGQIKDITESNLDGDRAWELSGRCVATTSGGDEFWLQFGTALTLVDTMTAAGTVGAPYAPGPLGLSGNAVGPITWEIASGAGPTGTTFNASTGKFTGNCSAAGTFTPTIRATDAQGRTATLAVSIVINP